LTEKIPFSKVVLRGYGEWRILLKLHRKLLDDLDDFPGLNTAGADFNRFHRPAWEADANFL